MSLGSINCRACCGSEIPRVSSNLATTDRDARRSLQHSDVAVIVIGNSPTLGHFVREPVEDGEGMLHRKSAQSPANSYFFFSTCTVCRRNSRRILFEAVTFPRPAFGELCSCSRRSLRRREIRFRYFFLTFARFLRHRTVLCNSFNKHDLPGEPSRRIDSLEPKSKTSDFRAFGEITSQWWKNGGGRNGQRNILQSGQDDLIGARFAPNFGLCHGP